MTVPDCILNKTTKNEFCNYPDECKTCGWNKKEAAKRKADIKQRGLLVNREGYYFYYVRR